MPGGRDGGSVGVWECGKDVGYLEGRKVGMPESTLVLLCPFHSVFRVEGLVYCGLLCPNVTAIYDIPIEENNWSFVLKKPKS